jgi:hypothetical protein
MGAYGSPEFHPAIKNHNAKESTRRRDMRTPGEAAGPIQPSPNSWPAFPPPLPPPYSSSQSGRAEPSPPPMYPVAPYASSSYGWSHPQPVLAPSNGLGVAAFVLGVIAIVLSWIPVLDIVLAAPAVILGGLGISRANHTPGMTKGLAIAGLVLGAISIVITFVVFAIFLAVDGVPAG